MENKNSTNKDKSQKKMFGLSLKSLRISPWIAGGIIGFLAASVQQLASMTKPPAYGFCMACHVRDFINSIINVIVGEKVLFTAPVIENPIAIPSLTFIGILLGAFVAAVMFKEFRLTRGDSYIVFGKMFVLGFLVMIFALILGACPIRTALRTAHGDVIAVIGLICIGIGAILATRFVLERKVEV